MIIIRPVPVVDSGSFTRASTAFYLGADGLLHSAANDTPRFSYTAGSLTSGPTLLLESAATNSSIYSEQLDSAAWYKGFSSVAANSASAPDGSGNADILIEDTTNNPHFLSQNLPFSAGTYTFSVFAKTDSRPWLQLHFDGPGGPSAWFNISTGVLGTVQGVGCTASISLSGNGYYRCSMTFVSDTASHSIFAQLSAADTVSAYLGNGSGRMFLWGTQVESGSVATSYITTTSAAVTRAADVNTSGLVSNVAEVDYSAYNSGTTYFVGNRVMDATTGIHNVYESVAGMVGTVTISIAAPCVVAWQAHGQADGSPVSFSTTGALPTGLTSATTYYVVNSTVNTFQLATSIGGLPISTSGTQSGVHTATASPNLGNTPASNPTKWILVGKTNRWRMFDSSVTSQTTNSDSIAVAIKITERVDSVALLNVNASTVRVILTSGTDGVVFDQTTSFISDSGITDWWHYFFEPIVRVSDRVVTTSIPPYAEGILQIILTDIGNTAACGACVIGLSRQIGTTEMGAKIGIQDYSVKSVDTFGNYTILERAFNKRADFTVWVDSGDVDNLQALLASYRAVPVVYIGSDQNNYNSTAVYGFYKDFEITIQYKTMSICTIQLEGLT